VFFCKGALETVKKLGWSPDVVHCHGWFSALVPAYVKTTYKDDPTFKDAKVMYSLFNEEFKGTLGSKYAEMAPEGAFKAEDAQVYGDGSYEAIYKGALHFTDMVVVADENVNTEIVDFARSKDIQVFEPNGDQDYDAFGEVYDQFAPEEVEA